MVEAIWGRAWQQVSLPQPVVAGEPHSLSDEQPQHKPRLAPEQLPLSAKHFKFGLIAVQASEAEPGWQQQVPQFGWVVPKEPEASKQAKPGKLQISLWQVEVAVPAQDKPAPDGV